MCEKYKWNLAKLQTPTSAHLVVTDSNYMAAKELGTALTNAVKEVLENPELNNAGDAAMYGTAEKIPDKSLINGFMYAFLENIMDVL